MWAANRAYEEPREAGLVWKIFSKNINIFMDRNNLDFSKFLMRRALFFYRYSFIQQQRILNYIIAEIKLNIEKET